MTGHIFISYSRQDGEYVAKLARFLQARTLPFWLDDQLDLGTRWAAVIQRRIETCAALLVVMSPRAAASEWVERELQYAQSLAKPIVPMLLEGSPFFGLFNVQHEDVTGGRLPSDQFVHRLRQFIGTAPPRVESTPAVVLTGPPPATGPPGSTGQSAEGGALAWRRRGSVAWGRQSVVFSQRLHVVSVVVLALVLGYLVAAIGGGINALAGGDRDTAPVLVALWVLATVGSGIGVRWGLRRTLTVSTMGITYRPIHQAVIRRRNASDRTAVRPGVLIPWSSADQVDINDGRLIVLTASGHATVCRIAWVGATEEQLEAAIHRFRPGLA